MGEMNTLEKKANDLRTDVLNLIYRAKAGHIGGDMSVMDILVSLYYDAMNISPDNQSDPDRDRFVMSKGHSVEALYVILADLGFFEKERLMETYSCVGSEFIGHPNNEIPGVEMNTGSLGHGLPIAVGMAIAGKKDKRPYTVYTVMGDGELAEGSVWEGFIIGGHYRLDNLIAIIDKNGLQISGKVEDVMSQGDLRQRISSCGWNVIEVEEGNNIESLLEALKHAKEHTGSPICIIANTIKGKGISFIENKAGWHHKVPNKEEYNAAKAELQQMRGA